MLDIPYRCESGFTDNGQSCPATTDETDGLITRITSTFDTYIEADMTASDNQIHHVIFGGLEWGYTYQNSDFDLPEPTSLAVFGVGLAGLGALRRRRRRQGG